ncbi:TonB family protein [Pontiellaceae bacterium B1224]|nr:TonB family protein [Pontiellaceae bacterium B1224]
MPHSRHSEISPPHWPGRLTAFGFQVVGALLLTALLLLFLGWLRWKENHRVPANTIRTVESIAPVQPPVRSAPPPSTPPEPVQLPELSLDTPRIAPPIKARIQPPLKPDFQTLEPDFSLPVATDFSAPEFSAPPVKTSYDVNELDAMPVLLNRPAVSYPAALARQGIQSGTVVMEVSIDPHGHVEVLRFTDSSHPDLERMARRFAERARFSAPKKEGRPVTATYHWPLKLSR